MAMASPMPLLAPVTIATLFSNNFMDQIYTFSPYEPPEKFAVGVDDCVCDRDPERDLVSEITRCSRLSFLALRFIGHRCRLVHDASSRTHDSCPSKEMVENSDRPTPVHSRYSYGSRYLVLVPVLVRRNAYRHHQRRYAPDHQSDGRQVHCRPAQPYL